MGNWPLGRRKGEEATGNHYQPLQLLSKPAAQSVYVDNTVHVSISVFEDIGQKLSWPAPRGTPNVIAFVLYDAPQGTDLIIP